MCACVKDVKDIRRGLRVTWLSVAMNASMGILKCGIGFWVNSRALLGDGMHSLIDLSTDFAALVGLKMSTKPEDDNHLYGHQKFSSLSSLFISGMLLLFCLGLIYWSVVGLLDGRPVNPEWPAVVVAGLSLIGKEWLYRRTKKIAREEGSRLLMVNAWHHRTDSFSSLLVFVALLAIYLGGQSLSFLDKGVGIVLGAWMGMESIKMFLGACDELLDAAPEKAIINDLREHVMPVPGVFGYHQFRVRRVGDMLEVDLHVQVAADITVQEGHDIASQVKKDMLEKHPEVLDVLVHIEPADEAHLQCRGVYGERL